MWQEEELSADYADYTDSGINQVSTATRIAGGLSGRSWRVSKQMTHPLPRCGTDSFRSPAPSLWNLRNLRNLRIVLHQERRMGCASVLKITLSKSSVRVRRSQQVEVFEGLGK
jgi:hypothetical protein